MWCTVRYFYIHAIRNALTTTATTAVASTFLSFPFPPDFRGPLIHHHPRSRRCTTVLDTPSSVPSFTFRTIPDASSPSSLLLVFSFFRRSWLQEFYWLPLNVHPADFISSYILHLLLTPSPTVRLTVSLPLSSPRHAFLGIFITQLCHYSASSLNSHNSRNFCLSDTPLSFFRCRASTSEGSFESIADTRCCL